MDKSYDHFLTSATTLKNKKKQISFGLRIYPPSWKGILKSFYVLFSSWNDFLLFHSCLLSRCSSLFNSLSSWEAFLFFLPPLVSSLLRKKSPPHTPVPFFSAVVENSKIIVLCPVVRSFQHQVKCCAQNLSHCHRGIVYRLFPHL